VKFLEDREILLEVTDFILLELKKYEHEQIIAYFMNRFGRPMVMEFNYQTNFEVRL